MTDSDRDIWEVANQLGSYVGPDTPDDLAKFLMRESEEAAKLASQIVILRKERELLSNADAVYANHLRGEINGASIVAAERERCARVAERFPVMGTTAAMAEHAAAEAKHIAAYIRKGGRIND